jgi:PAS domain S-box-containing protein
VAQELVPAVPVSEWSELAGARAAAAAGAARIDPELADAASLVASELLTNALLHGGGWALLVVEAAAGTPRGPGVRISVHDRERRAPVVAVASESSMTGRGLRLVSALSHDWGVDVLPDGKEVWAELAPGPMEPIDPDEVLHLWGDDVDLAAEPPGMTTVVIGEVPTDLLLRAKTHVDNVIREFKLASRTAPDSELSDHLGTLIDTVIHRFVEARESIKRQAVAAHEAGLPRTRLELRLGPDAADAGEAYLAALDEVDAYCRAMRLLTLETPPEQRVFRRWYVEEVVRQVRAAAAGLPAGPPITFEERLLEEVAASAAAQRASDRAARLAQVAVALSGANSAEDVSAVVLRQGLHPLAAAGAGVLLAADENTLEITGTVGYDEELIDRLRHEDPRAELPGAFALRTGESVWLESPEERDLRFPALAGMESDTVSMCAVPLLIGGRPVGALRFSFASARLFDVDERTFVQALAGQCAQALQRTKLEQKSQEDQFRAAVDSMLDPVMMCRAERDGDGVVVDLRVEYVNQSADRGSGRAVGMLISELWDGIREQGLLDRYLEVATSGEPLALDRYEYVDPSGRTGATGGVFDLRATRIGELVFIVYRDVTERAAREDEVLAHRAALAEAQRIANVGSWQVDVATGEIHWSEQFAEICGLPPEAPAEGRAFLALLPPDAAEELRTAVVTAGATGSRFQLEQELTRVDGDVRSVVITGEATTDNRGRILSTRGTMQDVTDRRFVELALRRSEERLREEHEAVQILQAAILPNELPEIAGATLVARYLAASKGVDVGGDFYDAFVLLDGRVVVTVGDVAGKGVGAAEAVGQLRNSLRMAAVIDPDPHAVVARLNELVALGFPAPFATAIVGVYDPATGALQWAGAGHLPLALRRVDGSVRLLGERPTHPPIGIAGGPFDPPNTHVLAPGESLLFFTDGLVERRNEDLDAGLARLATTVEAGPLDPTALVDEVVRALVGAEGRPDDVCLLLLGRDAGA